MTEFVTWWCKDGHEIQVHPGATAVWCGLAGHTGTNEMRPKDLFPNWVRKPRVLEVAS